MSDLDVKFANLCKLIPLSRFNWLSIICFFLLFSSKLISLSCFSCLLILIPFIFLKFIFGIFFLFRSELSSLNCFSCLLILIPFIFLKFIFGIFFLALLLVFFFLLSFLGLFRCWFFRFIILFHNDYLNKFS